jgi:hypothetical protein
VEEQTKARQQQIPTFFDLAHVLLHLFELLADDNKKEAAGKSKGSHGGCLYFDAGLDVYAGEGWFSP